MQAGVAAHFIGELSAETVHERFASARKSGLAKWVWPDIAVEDWRIAMTEVADVTRRLLASDSACAIEGNDTAALCLAGYVSGMGPLLGHWIEQGRLTATRDVEDVMLLHLSHNRDRVARLVQIAQSVVEEFSAAGIVPTIFKGMHTAFAYFPEPGVRSMSDIDIHVPPIMMDEGERILSGLGYQRTLRMRNPYMCDWTLPSDRHEPRTLMYVHRDDPWALDVQGSFNRRLPTGEQVWLDRLAPFSAKGSWSVSGSARTLCQPMLALQLAAHISQALLSVTLMRVTELAMVIRQDCQNGALKWDEFLAGANEIGGVRFVYPAMFYCDQLAPETVPAEVLAACRAGTPENLHNLLASIPIATAQPMGRISLRERFMWADDWRARLRQLAGELALDRSGRPLGQSLHSYGTKWRALWRSRLTA